MIFGIVDGPGVSRIGWALLQFLWQGTAIALALKGALMLVEQHSSRLRYQLALVCLFVMAALPVLLLCKPDLKNTEVAAAYESTGQQTPSVLEPTSAAARIQSRPEFTGKLFQVLPPLVPWVGACWLLGMTVFLLKTLGGVIQVQFLKRRAVEQCSTDWTPSFEVLAARSGIADVRVMESGLVSVPTVAGWFRPVVLLPTGVLEGIDHPMLDGLVAHEFAHIRRRDSIANLLQTLVEDLLFFHPAMWWVSRNVRVEREACCDDAAVAVCGDPLVYVRALSRAEQFRSSIPVIALSSSPLLHRIRRLTEMKISTVHHVRASCIAMLAMSFIIAAAAASILLAKIPPPANTPASVSAQETNNAGLNNDGKYVLRCGIVGGRVNNAGDKPSPFPPPPPKDGERAGGCMLLDNSKTGASKMVRGELEPSKLIHKVDPIYPESAVREHVGIRVMLVVSLDEHGVVTDVQVTKSQTVPPDRDSEGNWVGGVRTDVIKDIHAAAANAVRQWQYSPTLLNGKAVPVVASVSVTFTFNNDGSPKIVTFIG